ncbi:hypothetical protein OAJ60_02680 [Planctomycetaceae bacterium]|nr:hypothetical protein [Planctomycetaceae bacterium]
MTASSTKSLDRKLAALAADPSGCREFILADAKDADMAFGMGAPGRSPERHDSELQFRSLAEYRDQMRQIVEGGLVDIMLMSASTNEELTIRERLFDGSEVTPAVRANDTTDIHVVRGGKIHETASKPFRSASIDHIQCGHLDCEVPERGNGADLGLYSVTFANNRDDDLQTIEAYRVFRDEAERKGFRHFLEVFDPNLSNCVAPELLPGFINDLIARTLAGVTSSARPLFLKMVYHGPQATEELVNYDPGLVIGILGGSAGTTLDAFQLIHEAQKYGARVALFGRKINNAENQLAFVRFLRLIVDGELEPSEAVRAYHAVLEKLEIRPRRSLEDDLVLETGVMSYGGNEQKTISLPPSTSDSQTVSPETASSATVDASPDFASMTSEDRLAYHRSRLDNLLGP